MLANIVDIKVTGCIESPAEFDQMLNMHQPEVIIIDPNDNLCFTLANIVQLYERYPSVKVLVLTNKQAKSNVLAILDLGVKNHVYKACSREELVMAVYKTYQFAIRRCHQCCIYT